MLQSGFVIILNPVKWVNQELFSGHKKGLWCLKTSIFTWSWGKNLIFLNGHRFLLEVKACSWMKTQSQLCRHVCLLVSVYTHQICSCQDLFHPVPPSALLVFYLVFGCWSVHACSSKLPLPDWKYKCTCTKACSVFALSACEIPHGNVDALGGRRPNWNGNTR